jgi:hypothetical protein
VMILQKDVIHSDPFFICCFHYAIYIMTMWLFVEMMHDDPSKGCDSR